MNDYYTWLTLAIVCAIFLGWKLYWAGFKDGMVVLAQANGTPWSEVEKTLHNYYNKIRSNDD
jgi:hypothetical protein